MVKRKFVSTRVLQPGMKIDQAILDKTGRELIAKGAYLDDFQIEYLQKKSIGGIYVAEGEPDPEEIHSLEAQLPAYTKELIEKSRVEDKSKVTLSTEVIKRVGEGVQYLYDNVESENFLETTNNVTGELVKAIESNNAIAVDINLIKVSDEYTFKHSVDVATMGMIIGRNFGLKDDELRDIGVAGLLHDLGKSNIPLEILNKPGKLDDDEFALMKQHSLFGFKILKEKGSFTDDIMKGVLQHHEKMNGKGYPMGVTGESISKFAKILSVADIYDALVTERPYKKGFPKREALEMIFGMSTDLDNKAISSFMNSIIIFPVDSYVQLSNGETGKVVANNPGYPMRPVVIGFKTGKKYNLLEDIDCASMVIE
jgi:HD-GYP domain-containing protein (c-di-GMP phosphodiesterase class II)